MLSSVARRSEWAYLLAGLLVMALLLCAALVVGRGAAGWHVAPAAQLADLLPLRAPRIVVAVSAGMMLGVVGTLMQRMTGNPMAAPEVLGVSGGVSLGILLLFVATSTVNRPAMIAAGLVGALASLAMIWQTGRSQPIANDRLLLSGVAVATIASAFSAVMLASGDPRLDTLIGWLSGSTYRATARDAIIAAVTATALLAIMPLTIRWLEILPLGEAASRGLGLSLFRVRAILLVLISVPTTIATLVIGPLSFVGLMAPHLARMLGLQRALPQLFASAMLGGMILVSADWAGRMLIFPWQIPAGLLAALVGGPYFMVLMWKGRQ
ncbi:MAG: Fe(3+)-hydroxamate ABC transporter permease FhuB, partial [Mesorhizobium sp.]